MIAEEVHHITYLREDNSNEINITLNPKNLIALCYKCHKIRHDKREDIVVVDYVFDDDGNIVPREGV